MFLDEARVASRVQHPNVVGILDVAAHDGELLLVMDYVRGEALSVLLSECSDRPALPGIPIVASIVVGALHGLHAAHEARDEAGRPMEIVHRDVSPHNILVGADGIARVVDFGIAKAISRLQNTRDGEIKGKLSYLAPEQLRGRPVDRRTDVYAASVVLWEALTGRRLFTGDTAGGIVTAVLEEEVAAPSTFRVGIDPALDALVLRGLSRAPDGRFASALEMAEHLARMVPPAAPSEVGAWVTDAGGDRLAERARRVAELEQQKIAAPSAGASAPMRDGGPQVLSVEERRRLVEASTDVLQRVGSPSSSASAVEVPLPPRPTADGRGKRKWPGALFGAAALAGGVAAWMLFGPGKTSSEAPAFPPSPAEAAVEPQPVPSSSIDGLLPSPSAPAPPPPLDPEQPVSEQRPPAKPRSAAAPRARTRNGDAPKASATATAEPARPAPKPDCDPPYTIDENGIKRFKRWCSP
jgi:serine/threonine-protein kinase